MACMIRFRFLNVREDLVILLSAIRMKSTAKLLELLRVLHLNRELNALAKIHRLQIDVGLATA
jgi:hypothetical protein